MSLLLILASLLLVSSQTCDPNQTVLNGTDFGSTTRCPQYPQGLSTPSAGACCSICFQTCGCTAWVWMTTETMCFPCTKVEGTTPNIDRTVGFMAPPPPPPAPWVPRIAANDMLYTPTDAQVPSDLMPMIGNGFLATQVGSDSVWVSGLFNGYLTSDPSHRARIPATLAVGAPCTPAAAALDMREAVYYRRSYVAPSPPGACTSSSNVTCSNAAGTLWVEQRWYAHRALPSVMVMEVQVLAGYDDDGYGHHRSNFTSNVTTPYAMLLLTNSPGAPTKDLLLHSVTVPTDAPYAIVAGSTLVSETNTSGLQSLAILTSTFPSGGAPLAIPASAPFDTIFFLTVVRTSIETNPGSLVAAVQADYATALALAANGTLLSTHTAEWAETIWPSGFETDRGDLARAANASLYAILSSVRNDRDYGLSPGGLTNGYNGHSFWDCESWMFGPVNALLPDIGASLLQYRLNRLAGAREKAGTYDPPFSGAMFPWESALTGVEVCPSWAATGLREIHISGDIACAVWQFWRVTKDNSGGWLDMTGWPLLKGIAEFWMSKIAIDNPTSSPTDALNLNNVIPPDEYVDHVNNSVYTNAVAILSLEYAAAAAALVGLSPAYYAPWLDAAKRIHIPYDAERMYHPEYSGYRNGTVVKQADAILLGYPLEFSRNANDLNYYATVTDPGGPAMTWGMFSVGYVELGAAYASLAASNFNRSFANMQKPFLVWTETPTGGTPNFVTGAGGFLHAALFGYTGLRVNDTAVTLAPTLPEGSTNITLRAFSYLGNRLDITYDTHTLSVTVQVPPGAADIDAAAGAKARTYAHVERVEDLVRGVDRRLIIAAAQRPVSRRSQRGRVVLGGGSHVVGPQPLVLIDAAGRKTPLLPGAPIVLPTQGITILRFQ